eukprot:TRINITY_DN23277_c0_g1_i1.p1 TRINITY_DN23277_c0_g1~~TRINITY_DN23277_c0_g1_i1.p1  ORF type:complete len:103 (-),score=13.50 TRINITY_DN23277_c0_g1_i1:22-330(-)
MLMSPIVEDVVFVDTNVLEYELNHEPSGLCDIRSLYNNNISIVCTYTVAREFERKTNNTGFMNIDKKFSLNRLNIGLSPARSSGMAYYDVYQNEILSDGTVR